MNEDATLQVPVLLEPLNSRPGYTAHLGSPFYRRHSLYQPTTRSIQFRLRYILRRNRCCRGWFARVGITSSIPRRLRRCRSPG